MKKNVKKYFAVLSAAAAAAMCFAACGHVHTFTDEWSFDEESHWHAATCEHENEQGGKAKHSFHREILKEATCEESGTASYTCECGYSYTETVAALGHSIVTVPFTPATCETDGKSEHQACSRCDWEGPYQLIVKTNEHRYSSEKWEHDAATHWRPALCGCDRRGSEAAHSFTDGVCECGYEYKTTDEELSATFVFEDYLTGVRVTGLTEAGAASETLEIPTYYANKRVLAVKASAFAGNSAIAEITFPETVVTVDREAFANCTALKKVNFKNQSVSLGEGVFRGCTALEEIMLPEAAKSLPKFAFSGCASLKTVNLPAGLPSLGDMAFENCTALKEIQLPSLLASVNREAFRGCSALETITLPANVSEIGEAAFAGCTSLAEVRLNAKLKTIKASAFEGCASLETIELPADLTALGNQAFADCTALNEIKIPERIVKIGDNMFLNCSALSSVTLPAGLESIGVQSFARCTALTGIELPDYLNAIGQSAFKGSGLAQVNVPDSVVTVGSYVFAECSSLTDAVLSKNIDYHFGGLFADCSALAHVTVPFVGSNVNEEDAVTTEFGYLFGIYTPVNANAFKKVGDYYIPNALQTVSVLGGSVEEGAFDGCSMIAAISAEAGVMLKATSFEDCTAEIQYKGEPKVWNAELPETAFVNEAVTFVFEVSYGCRAEIVVKKGEEPAAANDYVYDEQAEKITFKTEGTFTVTVKAILGGKTKEVSRTVTVELRGPELTNVTVDKTECATEETVTLGYTAGEGTQVIVSVKKDGAAAVENTDYTYNETAKTLVFKTEGTFEIIVTGERNGKTPVVVTKSVTVTLPGPELSEITLKAEGIPNEQISLGFTAGEGTQVTVTVKKGGTPAVEGTDYTYDKATKTFAFKAIGSFEVTVTGERNGKTPVVRVKTIEITANPSITMEVGSEEDKTSATTEEGTAVSFRASVSYVDGDGEKTAEYRVFVQEGGNFVNADAALYEWQPAGGGAYTAFKPLLAGVYKIELSVESTMGGTAKSSVTVTATAADIELALAQSVTLTKDWVRMDFAGGDIAYTVTGYAAGYEVSFAKDDETASIAAASSGTAVTVLATQSNTVNFKVVYTHKSDETKKKELTVPVSFVSDLANAPILGSDPFGGTYGTLLSSIGLKLYFDAYASDGVTKLTYDNVTYEIVEGETHIEISNGEFTTTNKNGVEIGTVQGNSNYPFVIVKNFDDNSAHGTIAVRMTVKAGLEEDAPTTSATKTFEVKALSNGNPLAKYMEDVTADNNNGLLKYNQMPISHAENGVVAKEGLITRRDVWGNGTLFALRTTNGPDNQETNIPDNFQVDFEYTILKRLGNNNKASFSIYYRTGHWDGWCSSSSGGLEQTAFYAENDSTAIVGGCWGNKTDLSLENASNPAAEIDMKLHIRIQHKVENGEAMFIYQWSRNGTDYTNWFGYKASVSTENCKSGSPVAALQFEFEEGSFVLGNFSFKTSLD